MILCISSTAELTGSFDSEIELVVPESGTYVVEVASYEYLTGSEYTLTIQTM
jgi:hypothetical protein